MNAGFKIADRVTLPSGRVLQTRRMRTAGPLDREERSFCRSHDIPLAYDPAQIGWVPLSVTDDIDLSADIEVPTRPSSAEGAGLAFRAWHEDDAARMADLLGNAKVWEYLPESYPGHLSRADAEGLIALSNADPRHQVRAVVRDGEIVGQVRLLFDTARADEAEISYWLGERFWGQGLGSEMVRSYTQTSFETFAELRAIFARVHVGNPASAALLEKCGYTLEGPCPQEADWVIYRIARDTH